MLAERIRASRCDLRYAVRLLILTPYANANFGRDQASKVLLSGLQQRGIRPTLHRPWHPCSKLDRYDAALVWSYGAPWPRYQEGCLELEYECAMRGIPIINTARRSIYSSHADTLHRWGARGIPCARYERLHFGPEGIGIEFPLLLRTDGVHRGEGMVMVRDREEAQCAWDQRLAQHQRDPGVPMFDLAVSFVDTRWPDGLYRKWRSYVVGDRVIACHLMHGKQWLVNYGSLVSSATTRDEHKQFVIGGEPRPGLLIDAAQSIDAEIVGIDYTIRANGEYVLWEGNRRVNMAGDRGDYGQVPPRRCDFEFGLAVADYVRSRARASRRSRRVVM